MTEIEFRNLPEEEQRAWRELRKGKLILLFGAFMAYLYIVNDFKVIFSKSTISLQDWMWIGVGLLGLSLPWLSLDWIESAIHRLTTGKKVRK